MWYREVPTPKTRKDKKKMAAGAEENSPAEHSSWYFCSLLHRKASDRSRHQQRELLSHHKVTFSEARLMAFWVMRPRSFRGSCCRAEGITCLVQVGLVCPLGATILHLYPPVLYILRLMISRSRSCALKMAVQ